MIQLALGTWIVLLPHLVSNHKVHNRHGLGNQLDNRDFTAAATTSSSGNSKDNYVQVDININAAASNLYNLSYLLYELRRELTVSSLYPEFYTNHSVGTRSITWSPPTTSLHGQPKYCRITYAIDPYAIEFYREMLHNVKHQALMSQRYRFESDFREYLSEWLLMEYFLSCPCRININSANDDAYAADGPAIVPNYNIIFLPFKYLLSIKKDLPTATKNTITKVLRNVIEGSSFEHRRESYVMIHGSTLNYKELFSSVLTYYNEVYKCAIILLIVPR